MALRQIWARMTRLDRLIVVSVAFLCLLLFIGIGLSRPGETVEVYRDGELVFRAPLQEERTVPLEGSLGTTSLMIEGGTARIVDSPCPYKVCVGMGAIDHSGEIIACVPNRLLVRVVSQDESGKEPGYDLLSR
ncbi:MAG: hypothetical protein C0615_02615 [Desulfuromonas sp.]|nr:MAG: hypothetical protein C0615_02615 [Desulfuromonas sp.]